MSKLVSGWRKDFIFEDVAPVNTAPKKEENTKPQPKIGPTGTPAQSTSASTQTATPAPTAKPAVSDRAAELERLRGAAALKSLGDSPNASRLLAGKGRNQRSNEIVSKSIERSGLNRDALVKASREASPRYEKMVDYASKTDDQRAEIGRQAGRAMAGALADKIKTNTPKAAPTTKPAMDPFAAGGGNAKMKATGMTRDQVIALGNKNLKNLKPVSADDKKTGTAATTTQTKPTQTKPTGGLSPDMVKLYDKAYSNKGNPFAKGTIRNKFNQLTPEQQKAFRDHAKSQGHDWGNYFESYFDAVTSNSLILREGLVNRINRLAK